ncbi:MAG: hypothetical protein AAGL89_10690 [Pseudomonadota bacterium]
MPRTIWTKRRSDPNGTWTRTEGEPPFDVSATGGDEYDVVTDTGETFVIVPEVEIVAPTLSGVPIISGLAQVGETLEATAVIQSGTDPITTDWQWFRDGTAISGATAQSYTTVAEDGGTTLTARQTASNGAGSASATSAGVLVDGTVDEAPTLSGVPTISGIAQVGQTLLATPAASTGTEPITTTWQWYRDGASITGESGTVLSLIASDESSSITVEQTSTNSVGTTSSMSSPVIVAPAPSGDVAVISSLFVSDQDSTGEVVLAYAIDRISGVAGIVSTLQMAPTAQQIFAGQEASSAMAPSVFTDTWSVDGNETLPDIVSGLSSGTYYLHVCPIGGLDGDVVSSNGFQLETLPPVFVEGLVQSSGFSVIATFDKSLAGETSTDAWTVTANGLSVGIVSVDVAGSNVSLSLASQIGAGEIVHLSYSGNGLTDHVSNAVLPFPEQSLENQASGMFVEAAVRVSNGAFLTTNTNLPTDATGVLFFASLSQEVGVEARTALLSWNGVSGGIHADYTTGNGQTGTRLRIQDGVNSITASAEPIAHGTRFHLLVSSWIDGNSALNAEAWIFNTSTGLWSEAINVTETSTAGPAILLGPGPARLFARSDSGNHLFDGIVHRLAFWSGSGRIADISQTTVQDTFANGSALVDPAASRMAYGQPLIDFSGDADAYNSGAHTGSLGDFTASGTFTN